MQEKHKTDYGKKKTILVKRKVPPQWNAAGTKRGKRS